MNTCSFTLSGSGLRVNSNGGARAEEGMLLQYHRHEAAKRHNGNLQGDGSDAVSSSVLAKLAASMPVTREIIAGAGAGSAAAAAAVLALLVAAAGGDELAAAVGSSSSIMPPCFHACFDQCVQREEYWFCQFSCYRRCGAGAIAIAIAAGRFSGAGDCEHACALSMCGQIDPGSKMMAVCRDTCGKSYAAAGCRRRPTSLTAAV
ncbi:hypothetical protein OsI_02678 [Oryza sativa Indica Group]|uniref:Uncharacterized protein n=1 Tax=Oryza sativa subsp. indica TaxID=39946 RepID=A2WS37_ORYSI|nr:hypothetical protein OsI_02678 [Oryza sativa Indica Group]